MAEHPHPDAHPDIAFFPDGDIPVDSKPLSPPAAPTLPRLRRELGSFKTEIEQTQKFFRAREAGRNSPVTRTVCAAIVEAALDRPCSLILDYDDRRAGPAWKAWKAGETPEVTEYAADNVDLLFRIVHSAIAALRRLEAVNYPAPERWANLPPGLLAREVNAFYLAQTQQLAGWKDAD